MVFLHKQMKTHLLYSLPTVVWHYIMLVLVLTLCARKTIRLAWQLN